MSPFKAAILDMIKAAPNGVSSAELRKRLYPPEAARTPSLIRVHIHGINGSTSYWARPIGDHLRSAGRARGALVSAHTQRARAGKRSLDRECL
jgi:hypothetical protein